MGGLAPCAAQSFAIANQFHGCRHRVNQAYVPEPPVKSDYRGMLSAQASSAHRARPYDIEGGPLGPQGIQKLVRPLTVRRFAGVSSTH